jgi:hypothetical protein
MTESAFTVLQTYSLVQWRQGQGAYTIQKLVQAWGYNRLTPDRQQELSLTALELLVNIVLVEIWSKRFKKGDGKCTMLL